jgi:hypothetical protein
VNANKQKKRLDIHEALTLISTGFWFFRTR